EHCLCRPSQRPLYSIINLLRETPVLLCPPLDSPVGIKFHTDLPQVTLIHALAGYDLPQPLHSAVLAATVVTAIHAHLTECALFANNTGISLSAQPGLSHTSDRMINTRPDCCLH